MIAWKNTGWVLVVLFFCFCQSTYGQLNPYAPVAHDLPDPQLVFGNCHADALRQDRLQADPIATGRLQTFEYRMLQAIQRPEQHSSRSGLLTLPIVFHIVHDNGPENIPDQRIYDALSHLNDAFRNAGAFTQNNGHNTDIEFCLALRDAHGQPASGITRTISPLTVVTRETQDLALKNLIGWDREKYLNVWVVRDARSTSAGPGVAGYASFPFLHGNPEDGIVIEAAYLGNDPDDLKVLVHEVGHYLGLYHTFEGGCANNDCRQQGDRVCDTPPDASTAATISPINSCSSDGDDPGPQNPFRPLAQGGLGDQPDPTDNYMDYGNLDYLRRFTEGQKTRMRNSIQLERISLLNTNACISPCPTTVTADFAMGTDSAAINETVSMDEQCTGANTFTWFVDGTPVSSNPNDSLIFSQPGTYTIKLEAGNGLTGCEDTMTKVLTINCDARANFTASTLRLLPGEPLDLNSTSSNTAAITWLINGVPAGNNPAVTTQFSQPGNYAVQLIAEGSTCHDSSRIKFIEVGSCGREMHTLNWMFGDSAGLNFKDPQPTSGNLSIARTFESSASISDQDGKLLMYTNGSALFDRAHIPMQNSQGIIGNRSASQGAIILPYPANPLKYIVFTSDAIENTFFMGLRYSVVDMGANNGLGAVDLNQKNLSLGIMKSEMVAAVRHDNGRDLWLLTHEAFNSNFNAFLVTPNGVNPVPVVTQIGPAMMLPTGGFKVSPNREKVAISMNEQFQRGLALLDFDASTGTFSNLEMVPVSSSNQIQVYGVEWSGDNSKVYFTTLTELYQLDMTQPNLSGIIASMTKLHATPNPALLGMQRAENGKIYIAMNQVDKLHVINQPGLAGSACGFVAQGYDLQGAFPYWGLPNFYVDREKELDFVRVSGTQEICPGETGTLWATRSRPNEQINWQLVGDGSWQQGLTDSLCEFTANLPGMLQLIAERSSDCGISRDTQDVLVKAAPVSGLGNDTTLCPGGYYPLIAATTPAASYLWNNGGTTPTYTPGQPGLYSVISTAANGCSTKDSIRIDYIAHGTALVELGADTAVCPGTVVYLNADQGPGYTYRWSDGSQSPDLTTTDPGTYFVDVRDFCMNLFSDTIVVSDSNALFLNLGPDQEICQPVMELTVGADYAYIEWEDGSRDADRMVTGPGVYSVYVVSRNGCSARDTIELKPCTAVNVEAGLTSLNLLAWPNPADQNVGLQIAGFPTHLFADLQIIDAQGRLVRSRNDVGGELDSGLQLNAADIAPGIYFVLVTAGTQQWRHQLRIVH